jgi:hypothetical protein
MLHARLLAACAVAALATTLMTPASAQTEPPRVARDLQAFFGSVAR